MKKSLLFFVLLFLCTYVYSQQYKDMMAAGTYTVSEIQAAAEPYFETAGTGKGSGYKQYKRWEYDALHSMDEQGNLPALEAQLKEFFKNKKEQNRLVDTSNWEELGPTTWNSTSGWNPGVGRITSFSVDPDDQNHIIVGSPAGGVWRTVDGGTNWTVLTDDFINIDVYSLAIHPVTKTTYYWGSTIGIIFVSYDSGANWSELVNLSGSDVNKILIHPDTPSTMFCTVASGGVFRSTDSGANWSATLTGETTGYDIEFKPGDTNTVYATGNRFYKSTNGGASFTELSSPFTAGQTKMIGVSPADATVVYVLEENSGIFGGFYKSTNSGGSFIELTHTANYFGYSDTGNDTRGQAPRDMDIAVSPTDVDEVHIAGIHTWRSLNGGVNFTLSSYWSEGGAISRNVGYCHADVDIMAFVGSNLYVGSDGGLYINTASDAAISTSFYTDLTPGLGIRQFYKIGVSQTNPEIIVGGSQDNGSSFYNTSGQWFDWLGADGMENFIDKTNSDIFYGTSQGGSLYKSTNGGQSYFGLATPDGKSGNWVTPFEQDPITQNVIYSGYDQVYKSTNGGSTWGPISQDFGPNMDYLKIAPSNNQVMYGSVSGTLYKTVDGGATDWTTVTGYGGNFIRDIAIHPTDPDRVAIATNSSDKVYISEDGGATWTAMRLNLPSFSVYALVWENVAANRLFVGMNYGIYYIDDNNAQYQIYANNLPNVRVYEMEINTAKGMLYAGTYGRGVFRSLLPDIASDTQSPSTPANLIASNITQTTVELNWTASTDNIGVTGYKIFQDGVSIGTSATISYNVTGLTPSTSYDFTVSAFDANGNDSGLSNVETALTLDTVPVTCIDNVTTLAYAESFETLSDLGLWTQAGGDDGNWVQDSGGTPSAGTGPSSGSDGAYYLFLEASVNGSPGEIGANATAILEGPCLDLSAFANVQFTFDYHAFGDSIDSANLVVQGSTATDIWFDLFNIATPITSQDQWISESIDLSGYNENIKIRIIGTTGNGWSSDLAIDNVGFSVVQFACAGVIKSWNGFSWGAGGAPDDTDIVQLNANYDTGINGDLNTCRCTVESGRSLTVRAGDYVRVVNDITVDGTLNIEHTGSIVQVNDAASVTNNGTINVNLTTPALNARDFLIMGSPMSTSDETMFSAYQFLNHTTANFTPYVGVPPVVGVNFHDQDSNDWSNYTGVLSPAEGYFVRPSFTSGATYNYVYDQGTLNNGVITYAAFFGDDKEDSPNVLSNPYPSAIDADELIFNNAIVDELYFWEHNTTPNNTIPGPLNDNFNMEDISTRNYLMGVAANTGGGVPSNIISTGQGFGIKANAAGDVTFNNALRLTSGNGTIRQPLDKDLLWLEVRENTYGMRSTTGIGFTEGATAELDAGYDTMKLGTVVSLYSHLEDGSELLGIQGREVFDTSITIPMGFSTLIEADAGIPYVINISNLEGANIEQATVYLIDHLTNTITNLSTDRYEFLSDAGTFNNRFTLQFENEVLGTNDLELRIYFGVSSPSEK